MFELVSVTWLGPGAYRDEPHPFGSWTAEGQVLRVFYGLDHNGQAPGSIRVVEEEGEQVVIALTRRQPVGATTLIGGFRGHCADVGLRAPVGGRAVVDASTGARRPSLAELEA